VDLSVLYLKYVFNGRRGTMFLNKNLSTGALAIVAVYIAFVQPKVTAIATFGIGAILYAVSNSCEVVLAFLVASLFVRDLNRLFIRRSEPVGVEAFQVRDAQSIHARLESVRTVAPKVQAITGVLESPDILDNTPLQAMGSLASEGVPGASIPASAKARVLIYPPAEDTIPASNVSTDARPVMNPFLQNGEDDEGVETSLFHRGTDMMRPKVGSSDLAGVDNAGNAY
jgi:hypothetical protein